MPEQFKVDKSKTYDELMQLKSTIEANNFAQLAKHKPQPKPALPNGISEQTHYMAQQVLSDPYSGKRIGDCINNMESEHKRQERENFNANDHQRKQERLAARLTNTQQASIPTYQPQPFDRDQAQKTLISNYPWLSPTHRDNPDMKFFLAQAERTKQQIEELRSGDINAPNNYKIGQAPLKSYS
jgi:hypothetical protein